MAETANRNATYEDLLGVAENMIGEIIGGELIVTPRPAHRHIFAASCLGAELIPPYQHGRGGGPGGWIILAEPEIHFSPEDITVPDYAGWRKERFATPPEEHRYVVIPDWICEILSPGTAQRDRIVKMRLFAQYRVRYVWLIDPELKALEAYKLEHGKWSRVDALYESDKVSAEPFREIEFDLAVLWPGEPEDRGPP